MEQISEIVESCLREGKRYFEKDGRTCRIRDYELTIVLRADLSEVEEKEVIAQIKDQIRKNLGKITHEEEPKTRVLAYKIGKHDRGKYYYFEYAGIAEPDMKFLKLNPNVLRYLLVLKESVESKGHLWRKKMKKDLEK